MIVLLRLPMSVINLLWNSFGRAGGGTNFFDTPCFISLTKKKG